MKPSGNREVEAVVFTGIQPLQELEALLESPLLRPDGLCTAQRQIMHRTRPRLITTELRDSASEILVDRYLDAGLRRRHANSVPYGWYTIGAKANAGAGYNDRTWTGSLRISWNLLLGKPDGGQRRRFARGFESPLSKLGVTSERLSKLCCMPTGDLASLCFRRVPSDVVDRDVVLAALWHLLLEYAKRGLSIEGRTVRHTHLGKRAGLRKADFNAALAELRHDGLIGGADNGYCLTRRGYRAIRELVDVDRTIELAKATRQAA